MHHRDILTSMQQATDGLRLLEHPFYRRWTDGKLTRDELASYAAQYRHFEEQLPGLLHQILEAMDAASPARPLVEANLADELGGSGHRPHLAVYDDFASFLDVDSASDPTPATASLLATHRELAAAGPAAGLAGLLAYESQLPEVATSKAQGLRDHFGATADATAFWDLHAVLDVAHGQLAVDALDQLEASPELVFSAARRAAEAWWAFLDERETVAAAS